MCYYRDRSESFKASHGTRFIPGPRGRIPGADQRQSGSRQADIGCRAKYPAPEENHCQNPQMNRTGNEPAAQSRIYKMSFAFSPTSPLNPWLQILAALEKKV